VGDDITARLERLELIETAKAVTARYGRVIDAKDGAGLAGVFSDDVVLHLPSGDRRGIDAVRKFFTGAFAEQGTRRHFLANQIAEVTADNEVRVQSYFLFISADDHSVIGWGAYDDRVRGMGDAARITDKTIVLDVHTDLQRGWARGPL
jgi:ketosteroid isomerase-like protein